MKCFIRFFAAIQAATICLGASPNLPNAQNITEPSPLEGAKAQEQRRIEIYNEKKPSIVRVRIESAPDKDAQKTVSIGTGFFISAEGHVLTSDFGIKEAGKIWIEHGNIVYEAKVVGCDARTHVAILKAEAPHRTTFPFIVFSEQYDLPKIGSTAIGLLHQMGLEVTPVEGIITGHDRRYFQDTLATTHLRASIEMGGGDTGGAVFDLDGNCLGMIAIALPEIRSSFILPTRALRRIRDDILFHGVVSYAYFGIEVEPEWDSEKNQLAVVVARAIAGSPAEKAGLRKGDKLLMVAGTTISDWQDVIDAFFFARPDTYTTFTIQRHRQQKEIAVRAVVHENPLAIAKPEENPAPSPTK